jgi:hypothetical protein
MPVFQDALSNQWQSYSFCLVFYFKQQREREEVVDGRLMALKHPAQLLHLQLKTKG